jgi:glycosyltransferase involved in cell wall biosynthesis
MPLKKYSTTEDNSGNQLENLAAPAQTVAFLAIGYSGVGLGGGDSLWLKMAEGLLRFRFRILVVTSKEGWRTYRKFLPRAKFVIVDKRILPKFIPMALLSMARRIILTLMIVRKLGLGPEDLVISTSDLLQENIPILALQKESCIKISIFHMIYPAHNIYSKDPSVGLPPIVGATLLWLQQMFSIAILKRFFDIIIANENTVKFLANRGVPEERTISYPLQWASIDLEAINSVQEPPKRYDACWVGRYSPRKGFEDLLIAWKSIISYRPSSKLAIVGSVCYDPTALFLIRKIGSQGIELKGFLPTREKIRAIKESKIFIHTSHYEGQPSTPWEAIACHVPVVCYDYPFNRELPASRKVLPGEIGKLAEACLGLFDNEMDLANLKAEAARLRIDSSVSDLLGKLQRRISRLYRP